MFQSFDPPAISPITNVPNELLEQIFTFLDPTSLKSSLLVDRRWNAIISSSPKTMELLPLTVRIVDETSCRKLAELKTFKRCYQVINIEIDEMNPSKNLLRTLTQIGQQVKTIKFVGRELNVKQLEILKLFSEVENIELRSIWRSVNVSDHRLHPTQLANLKSLKISGKFNFNVTLNL
jgi:hypothetical protein